MRLTSKERNSQPTAKTETTLQWEDFIVEELDDETATLVRGGAANLKSTDLGGFDTDTRQRH